MENRSNVLDFPNERICSSNVIELRGGKILTVSGYYTSKYDAALFDLERQQENMKKTFSRPLVHKPLILHLKTELDR